MVKNLLRLVLVLAGIAIGPGLLLLVYSVINQYAGIDLNTGLIWWVNIVIYSASAILSGIITFIFSEPISKGFLKFVTDIENKSVRMPARTVIAACLGLVFGVFIAYLFSSIVYRINIEWISIPISIVLYIMCGYTGIRLFAKTFGRMFKDRGESKGTAEEFGAAKPKILDTSVIIDGRIFDICKTGIIEGTIVIPEFVLSELRHIADSADILKRGKGRRGLDILSKIQKELDIPVEITDTDYEDLAEVDQKLLRLAKELNGKVITNDFNLNKVAAVQSVPVLNINDLSNAVKPVLIAGEELLVTVMKEGKEAAQGIAYLEDGTMIVVENAKRRIGQTLGVVVTSVLQTSAGRMIFARVKE